MLKPLCIVFLLSSSTLQAQVHLQSFYFDNDGTSFTDDSQQKFSQLNEMQNTHTLQIIELDAYSSAGRSGTKNSAIAKSRVDYFIESIALEPEDISIVNYGGQRIPLFFVPLSWNRIDIYYHISPKRDSVIVELPEDTIARIIPPDPIVEIPKDEKIELEVPIVMPITFKGGKTKISESSYIYLDSLYLILVRNPDITAHIRGHVCCKPKRYKSRKRAKSVFKSLVNKGIAKDRLSFDGYSNTLPVITPERTEMDRKVNRRVDIIFK